MKNILVTGGTGFIGSHTVVELVNSGYQPIIIDNLSNSDKSVIKHITEITGKPTIFYEGDYQDEVLLKKILNKYHITGVIHFAAYKAVGESVEQPLKYYENNVAGFIKLLKIMQEEGVSNLVFSSSCTVYGQADQLPITEDAQVKPAASPYGATKQMDETIIRDVTIKSASLRSLSLRYFNPIGAHPSGLIGELPIGIPANLIPYVTQTAAGIRKKIIIFGNDYNTPDGTCIRDYIHIVDLAKAHVKALEHVFNQSAGYYNECNIGTGKGSSVLEIIKTFESATGQKVPYEIGPRRGGDIESAYASVDKAKKLLSWQSEKNLKDALQDAWRWQQNL